MRALRAYMRSEDPFIEAGWRAMDTMTDREEARRAAQAAGAATVEDVAAAVVAAAATTTTALTALALASASAIPVSAA